MEQSIDVVASNLKTIRESRKISLDRLSELTGVSKSMLRQIEIGKSSPTIGTIWKIANGLKVSFTSLLRKPVVEAKVRSFREGKPLTAESEHYRVYPLIPFEPEQSYETYFFEMDPDTVFSGEPHEGNVYEYVFVIKGQLEINVDGKTFSINENEFLQFQANCPHDYKCIGKKMVSAIMQISYLS
ncbi:MAG: helix-turn-helix transcriptional regulator [Desulfobacula sp.]|uniref:helix-turn-helix domain-containing protein n=1 Tax=Desulfobacula sp. TaxID=2593537 RepID=UPI0025C6B7A0|nr:XRE family transcriptional regulator [Desulfobacula sp.]MBC2703691.1 helix-turn-helix transcriptional regulator [Desulfobacula sp.]MCK5349182.1 helix-turn-helix transcriptional regulator [Desulfobacula sp.]